MVHTAAVFLCQQKIDVLQPFVNMLNNPAMLVVSVKFCTMNIQMYYKASKNSMTEEFLLFTCCHEKLVVHSG